MNFVVIELGQMDSCISSGFVPVGAISTSEFV
jgi:hypothetical protein